MKLSSYLKQVKACKDAVEWSEQYDSLDLYEALKKAWNECDDGGWMLWFAGKIWNEYTSEMRLAACDIAESVVHLTGEHETICREAIAVARRYAIGEATEEELKVAYSVIVDSIHYGESSAALSTLLVTDSTYSAVSAAYDVAFWAVDSVKYLERGNQQLKNAELTRRWITADMVVKQVKSRRKRKC